MSCLRTGILRCRFDLETVEVWHNFHAVVSYSSHGANSSSTHVSTTMGTVLRDTAATTPKPLCTSVLRIVSDQPFFDTSATWPRENVHKGIMGDVTRSHARSGGMGKGTWDRSPDSFPRPGDAFIRRSAARGKGRSVGVSGSWEVDQQSAHRCWLIGRFTCFAFTINRDLTSFDRLALPSRLCGSWQISSDAGRTTARNHCPPCTSPLRAFPTQ